MGIYYGQIISSELFQKPSVKLRKYGKSMYQTILCSITLLMRILRQMYIQEKQNAQMAVIFSILAIFIASLGLFGLTSFTVEQRTKEIGVRKAMGSSVAGIYFVISREILILVSISALIAWPLIYYIAGKWLENFYYRINIGVFSLFAGLAIALGIALLTISYRIMKAARVNPAQSLKYE